MKKFAKGVLLPIIIIAISLGVGYLYDDIWDDMDRRIYPQKYQEHISKYSKEYGVPEYIVYATVKVESDFDSGAVSSKGAIGLMQITPDTFDWLQLLMREELDQRMLYDPETNIKYGTYLLSYLYDQFGNWETVHAAYNAGMTRVKGWLNNAEYSDGDGTLKNIPFEETREYVKKIADTVTEYKKLYY